MGMLPLSIAKANSKQLPNKNFSLRFELLPDMLQDITSLPIAEKYGGGGHEAAAGFGYPLIQIEELRMTHQFATFNSKFKFEIDKINDSRTWMFTKHLVNLQIVIEKLRGDGFMQSFGGPNPQSKKKKGKKRH